MPNAAPVAVNDGVFNSHHGEQLNVAAVDGVLKNDTDADFDTLTAVLDVGPMYGTSFTLHASGAFDYVPDPAYSGPITFTYYAFDGTDYSSSPATVTINVYWTATELYDAYQAAVGAADENYADAVNPAIGTRNGDIAALRAAVPGDAAALYTTYQNAFASAQTTYTGAVGVAETAYNGAVTDADNAWTTAYEDAGDDYDAAMTAAQGAYDTTMANLLDAYNTATTNAEDAYDYAYNNVILPLEAARDAAYDAWQLDLPNTSLEDAYHYAQSDLDNANSMASTARTTAYTDAQTTRNNGETQAGNDLLSAQAMAQSDYENDLADADLAWETAEGMASSAYASAKTSANEAFTGAESNAWSMYVDSLATLLSTLASAEAAVVGTFDMAVGMALSAWQTPEGDAWSAYTTEMDYVPGSPSLGTRITAPTAVTDNGVEPFEEIEEEDRDGRFVNGEVSDATRMGELNDFASDLAAKLSELGTVGGTGDEGNAFSTINTIIRDTETNNDTTTHLATMLGALPANPTVAANLATFNTALTAYGNRAAALLVQLQRVETIANEIIQIANNAAIAAQGDWLRLMGIASSLAELNRRLGSLSAVTLVAQINALNEIDSRLAARGINAPRTTIESVVNRWNQATSSFNRIVVAANRVYPANTSTPPANGFIGDLNLKALSLTGLQVSGMIATLVVESMSTAMASLEGNMTTALGAANYTLFSSYFNSTTSPAFIGYDALTSTFNSACATLVFLAESFAIVVDDIRASITGQNFVVTDNLRNQGITEWENLMGGLLGRALDLVDARVTALNAIYALIPSGAGYDTYRGQVNADRSSLTATGTALFALLSGD